MVSVESFFAVLGVVAAARWGLYILLDLLSAFRKFVWARLRKEDLALKYGGRWAVVTGCTDGIGKEYARQLARRGMNILLISRSLDKLEHVQQLIKDECPGVETETVQVDFSHGRNIYPEIHTRITGKDIGILVNNVGVALNYPKSMVENNDEEIWNHINVNMVSVVCMTKLVLSSMVARGRGAIINVASIMSNGPLPYLNLYCATKAFVDYFSESLSWELRGTGVTVQTLRPGVVITNMTNYIKNWRKPSLFVATTSDYVSSSLPTLGHCGRTTGYWSHGLLNFVKTQMLNWQFYMYFFDKKISGMFHKEK